MIFWVKFRSVNEIVYKEEYNKKLKKFTISRNKNMDSIFRM